MFKREYTVLVIFVAMLLVFPAAGFSIEKADKDALLQEISGFISQKPEFLKNAVLSMADDYVIKMKTDEAIALYEKALKVLPDSEDILSRLANLYSNKSDFAKTAEIYKKITEANPNNIWNFQMLSNAYKNAGQKDKAALVWENLTNNSKNAEVFIQASNFYSGEGNADKAIAAINKAIELAPDNVSYLQVLEGFYMRADKFSEAEAICSKILTSGKEAWQKDWANSELLNIYQRQNKLGDLAVKFEKDLSQSSKDIGKYRNLAELYQRSNELDKAAAVYEKAITSGFDDKDTNSRLFDVYERSGKLDKAEAQLRKVIVLAPSDNYLYERLADLLGKAGKKDDAKKMWDVLVAKAPNDANLIARYGDKLNEWGDAEGAVAQYRKAQSLDTKSLWYTMRVVDIFIGKENFDAAKKELNAIIAKTTDSWMKQEAERKIKDIDARSSMAKAAPVPTQAPVSTPVMDSKTAPKSSVVVVPAPSSTKPALVPKPAEKKKGLFSR